VRTRSEPVFWMFVFILLTFFVTPSWALAAAVSFLIIVIAAVSTSTQRTDS
jgi:ABC-type protease/lipase transport system fused ATPase/permease subunit